LAFDAGEFDVTSGRGLFDFSAFDNLPRTSRIVLVSVSYSERIAFAGPTPGGFFVYLIPFQGAIPTPPETQRILLGNVTPADALGPAAENLANVTFCGRPLPRSDPSSGREGRQWLVQCFSPEKSGEATVCVDYLIQPYPDTSERETPA